MLLGRARIGDLRIFAGKSELYNGGDTSYEIISV